MRRLVLLLVLVSCGSSSDDGGGGAGDGTPPTGDGVTNDAGPPQSEREFPIGEWVWHDVAGTMCANGTPTGFGVNRGAGSRVVVYMSGGSACLDERCSIGTPSMRKDGGFGAAQLAECAKGDCDGAATFPSKSIFNRSAGASPFSDDTWVFISNCSGDYYVGDGEHAFSSWTAQFRGSRNQGLFAAAAAALFPRAARAVLTGGSAGSVGAMLNYWQWVKAFGTRRVDLIADSFALVFQDGPEWRYPLHNPQSPPDCATCATDYRTIYDYNAKLSPSSRIAVLDSENNLTLDLTSAFRYTQGLADLQPRLDLLPNTKYYVADGNVHILMQHPLDSAAIDVKTASGETHRLSDFLDRMQRDDPAWSSLTCLGD